MPNIKRALLLSALVLATTLFFTGCATTDNPVPGGTITYTIPDLPESGFLGDYSQMTLAKEPAFAVVGRKIYINPNSDLSGYNKVVIDPVSFDYYEGALEITIEEEERLARYLKEWLNLKLKDRFRKVGVAGPQTLRVRTAITDLRVPESVAHLRDARDDNLADAFVVVVELELSNSVTNERYLAMVDPMGGVRFTIARQDLSEERDLYINWMDGLSSEMEDQAMKVATPDLDTTPELNP